ncbi:hypothetical protein PG988_012024 [Apiospora saccharicola]
MVGAPRALTAAVPGRPTSRRPAEAPQADQAFGVLGILGILGAVRRLTSPVPHELEEHLSAHAWEKAFVGVLINWLAISPLKNQHTTLAHHQGQHDERLSVDAGGASSPSSLAERRQTILA